MEPSQTSAPALEPKPESENIMATGTPKKGKGMLYGMIILAIVAIAGIGFGVWAMLDKKAQEEQLNSQITVLKTQTNELLDKLSEAETEAEAERDTENAKEEQETVSSWPVKVGVLLSDFYVLNDSDKVVTKDESINIVRLEVCDSPVGPGVIKEITCGVVYDGGKEGMYLYDGETGTLRFYTIDEWKAYLDSNR